MNRDRAQHVVARFTISRSMHSSFSPQRQTWQQLPNACRQAYKEPSSWDYSARIGRRFTVGGRVHGVVQNDRFYAYETNGVRAREWVASIVAGQPVASVDCTNCCRPDFRFVDGDLRIVERAVELLSPAGAWDPQERAGGCCPTSGSRYTLRCALRKAAGDVTGVIPTNENENPAAVSEVAHSILDRMGTRERLFGGPPLVVYRQRADGNFLLDQQDESRNQGRLVEESSRALANSPVSCCQLASEKLGGLSLRHTQSLDSRQQVFGREF